MMRALITTALVCAAASPAIAERKALHDAVSLELMTLQPTALMVELDHDLRARKLSLAGAVGVRSAALGDYSSWTYGAGIELRRWRRQAMRGWYAGARLELSAARTIAEMDDRGLGTMWTTATSVSVGYRLVFIQAVELTPSVGMSAVVERGPMSPATVRGAGVVGLTAGVTF